MRNFRLHHQVLTSLPSSHSGTPNDIFGDYDSGDYVLDLVYNQNGSLLVSSSSDRHIRSYDSHTFQLVSSIFAHESRISSLEASRYDPNIILTASEDQTMKCWDVRHPNALHSLSFPEDAYGIALGLEGRLIAACSGTSIYFFDSRKLDSSCCLGEYADIHTDMISGIHFNPVHDTILASSSEDGLICTYDTSVSSGQDAVLSILNVETPISRFGFFGIDYAAIYALTSIETLSVWHHPSAQRINHFSSIRESHGADYLIDCLYDPYGDSLVLGCGTYSGNGEMLLVQPESLTKLSDLSGGHNATVRCMAAFPSCEAGLTTGGEDSRICHWKQSAGDAMADGEVKRKESKKLGGISSTSEKKALKTLESKPY
jgi:WD repeat-containing protein 89